ncbi:hypothetical protein [Sphingomonas sp. DBB INV C78]|uniref:hypothetical protein n=1 Tax=Sphingomonas sp. DBB INV C78 TaxID=3349434 RepID=UPI0036D3ABDB
MAVLLLTSPVVAKPAVPLVPFGIPFLPESPKPVAPSHPLYQRIALNPIVGMPDKIGAFLIPITNLKEFEEALRETLAQANMLAPPGQPAQAHLTVRWITLDAPTKISFSSNATSSISYVLTRSDNGQQIFARDISTSTKSTGGDGADRLKGNARLAILSNLASAVVCLDKAALGLAPSDCALTPQASYRAARMTYIFVPR